jgi:hypothetical protein
MDIWLRPNGRIATAKASTLNRLTIGEAILMAETRAVLEHALANLTVSDDLRTAAVSALRQRQRATAPFLPLNATQRLGWLDEVDTLACSRNGLDGFTPGASYRLTTHTLAVRQRETRSNDTMPDGSEEVLVTGTELLAALHDDHDRHHVFCHHTPPTDQLRHRVHAIHHLDKLVRHFHIPDVPDIARLFPARFKKLKEQFAAL